MNFQPQSFFSDHNFEDEHLTHLTIIANEFHDCKFSSCIFTEVVFEDCRFINCRFWNCDLSLLGVPGSFFSDCQFDSCRLIGIDWTQADWKAARLLIPLSFYDSSIDHSTFIGLSLPAIRMENCSAVNVDFREADLSRTVLKGSTFSESLFSNTNLSEADLRGASNYHIDPEQNKLNKARFSLPEAMSLLFAMNIVLETEDSSLEPGQ